MSNRGCRWDTLAGPCDRPHYAKGLCRNHYKKSRRVQGLEATGPRWDDRRASMCAMRRAARLGAPVVEYVSIAAVHERSGWLCGVCLEPIDPDIEYPDPASATIDHCRSLKAGGSHVMSNLQSAHLACNSRKGD